MFTKRRLVREHSDGLHFGKRTDRCLECWPPTHGKDAVPSPLLSANVGLPVTVSPVEGPHHKNNSTFPRVLGGRGDS